MFAKNNENSSEHSQKESSSGCRLRFGRRGRRRTAHGMAITTLITFIAVFMIGPVSMMVYEVIRYNLAQQELKHCVDAAALAAGCAITGSNSGDLTMTDQSAMQQGLYMFQRNTILGQPLTTATYTYDPAPGGTPPNTKVAANGSALYYEFLNPTGMTQVGMGGANGKVVRLVGTFGFTPDFANFIGLPNTVYPVVAQSDGGLPMLDVVLCFDLSASMDDFTNVSLVNRYTNAAADASGSSSYAVQGFNGYNIVAQNNLYTAVNATSTTGTSVNASYPMQLDQGGGSEGTITFNSQWHGTHTNALPPMTAGEVSNKQYSDMVIPLDGSANCANPVTITGTYAGTPYTYQFPSGSNGVAVLVEAARGNLESTTVAANAGLKVSGGKALGVTLQPGWFAAYYAATNGVITDQNTALPSNSTFTMTSMTPNNMPLRHPIGDGIKAAESFFQILNTDADVHFGVVCFSSGVGSSASSSQAAEYAILTNSKVSSPFPSEPIAAPLPYVALQSGAGASFSNYSTSTPPATSSVNGSMYNSSGNISGNALPPFTVVAEGGTDISDALNAALAMYLPASKSTPNGTKGQNLTRKGSTPAIVLFTDGLPNGGGDSLTSDPNAQAVATSAGSNNVPIYTIGLSLVSSLQAQQTTVLTDAKGSKGIAALSGNGATFTQTSDSSKLTAVFQNIARQLVQLVQ